MSLNPRRPRHGRATIVALVVAILVPLALAAPARGQQADEPWIGVTDDGTAVVELYFVFSSTCPHCRAALPFVADLAEEHDWLRVWWLQADAGDPAVAEIANRVAEAAGEAIRAVPAFAYCGTLRTGWDGAEGMGATLANELAACRDTAFGAPGADVTTTTIEESVSIPGVGDVTASSVPLPVFTAIVAGLDAFNPCAFFVLLFLLSLLVHARSRVRIAAVGLTFVAISGLLYFVFMAAWLNLFLVTEHLRGVTLAAGVIAVGLGALSAKDYFAPDVGPSVSIPETAKPGLFARMRGLIAVDRMAPAMIATVTLAVVANSYELLCTAGLPMVFTRVLTLNDLSTPTYYGYLALYNAIYVVPLAAIVLVFVRTLGSRKLQATEGRILKLVSGSMMLGLGAVLLFAPHLLERVGTAIAVVLASIGVSVIIVVASRHLAHPTTSA